MSGSHHRAPQLFCKGLQAADDFLEHWTQAQQQLAARSSSPSRTMFPFETLCSDELQAVTTMVTQVTRPSPPPPPTPTHLQMP